MNCTWPSLAKGEKCIRCGYKLPRNYNKSPRHTCGSETDCPHLLGSFDPQQSTLVYGCGCASTRTNGQTVTVSECALHGRCVTFSRGTHLADATIKRCVECEDNPRKATK